jgi:tetratricopeptide (TPR) repeat protein
MALAADRSKNFEKAFEYYNKSAQIGYNVPVSYTLATLALREQKKNDEALEYVKKARLKFPNDKDLILQMVNISLDAGDNQTAEISLEEAIAKDPKNPQLWVAVGMVYEQLGKSEQAEKALLKGVELDPKSENGNYSLGAHYVNLAAAQFEEASKMKLNDPNYETVKGQSAANYEKAIPFLEKTLEINPDNVEVMNTLFRLYRQLGNSEKALEYKKRIDAMKQ